MNMPSADDCSQANAHDRRIRLADDFFVFLVVVELGPADSASR